jgi:hypothetical protein
MISLVDVGTVNRGHDDPDREEEPMNGFVCQPRLTPSVRLTPSHSISTH